MKSRLTATVLILLVSATFLGFGYRYYNVNGFLHQIHGEVKIDGQYSFRFEGGKPVTKFVHDMALGDQLTSSVLGVLEKTPKSRSILFDIIPNYRSWVTTRANRFEISWIGETGKELKLEVFSDEFNKTYVFVGDESLYTFKGDVPLYLIFVLESLGTEISKD